MAAEDDEEMTVELDLDDGRTVTCDIITVLEVEGKNYIALLPRSEKKDDDENEEVWFYGIKGSLDDSGKEPELEYIDDDETYEKVTDAFDEFLDSEEFEEISSDLDDDKE